MLIVSFFFILTSNFTSAQQRPKQEKQTTRILFVFDASFSMYGQWQSGQKIDIAKKMLGEFLDSLVDIPDLEIALRCYGHQSKLVPVRNCKDTKLEVPFSVPKKNVPLIIQRLKSIIPMGTTPIAYSLEQAAGDFPTKPNVRNIIILITDGIEECDGDPCAVSMALQQKGIVLKPFVIGIGMDQSYINTFGCIGKYYDVSNEVNFKSVLNIVISQALNNTTAQVNLLDNGGKPTETDVNMTFYDEFSGAIRYNYLHTINNRGNPDTVILDPLATYHLVVHTIPPVEKTNITLTPGKHTIIALDAPQGYLNLKVNGINNYKSLQCIVRKAGEMKTLNVQEFNEVEKYITGKYDLEILTLPRIYLDDVQIRQSSTNTVAIPQAGMISIQKPGEGSGSLYVEEKNKMVWVCNLQSSQLNESILLQPGNYRIEFRPKSAKESIYTVERQFKIESGSTTSIKLY